PGPGGHLDRDGPRGGRCMATRPGGGDVPVQWAEYRGSRHGTGFRYVYLGGEYGSGVPGSIGGYFFRLSKNSATILVTGATTHELYQGNPSRSSFRSVRRLMTFGSGRVNGGSYIFSCQIKCTFQ